MLKYFELIELPLMVAILTAAISGYIFFGRFFYFRLPGELPVSTSPGRKPIHRIEKLILLLALALAFLLDPRGLTRGFNYDELYSAYHFIDVDSLWTVLSTYRYFNNHIGYSVFAWLGRNVLGKEEWVIRLPALLLGMAGIFSSWVFSRRFFGPRIAGFSSLLLAFAPSFVTYSRSARGYTGLIFFTVVSSHLYLKLLETPRRRDAVLFILVSVMGIYFHLYAGWVIAVQILYLVILSSKRQNIDLQNRLISRQSFLNLWISFPLIFILSFTLYLPVLDELLKSLSDRYSSPSSHSS
jgi:4-amino-4-deoxy-L-arabinose transferase-like glycosyltransferase